MARRVWTDPNIDHDIEEIYSFIARDDPSAAQRVVEAIVDTLEEIAAFPELGSPINFKASGEEVIRRRLVSSYKNYSVYYRLTENELQFLYVHHGSRNESLRWQKVSNSEF